MGSYQAVCLLAVVFVPLAAQEFRSTITGSITDPQGLGVPDAKITLRNLDNGALSETKSVGLGQYVIPLLPPGEYSLQVEAKGLRSYVRPRVRVQTSERLQLDIRLEVGAVQDVVTVSSDVPLLQTSTANTGQILTSKQIENLPMNGRTPLMLAQLAVGVVTPNASGFSRPFDNAGPSEFSMGGAPSRANEILMDGAPNTNKENRVAYNPPVDAVQEMRIDTFQSDAAFGNTVGGVVNMVMKSGTNTLHGSAYWFNQVAALNATPFFTNAAGQPKPAMRFNQYGASLGGPVVIPKLGNGRDKVFFYFAYEGIRDAFPRPQPVTVPTEAMRRGDFSSLLALGTQYQIYDPATGAREGGRVRRQPFAGNIIPASRLSPIAVAVQRNFPGANTTGRADGLNNFLSSKTGEENNFFNYLYRGDWNINAQQRLSGNFRYNVRESIGANELGCRPSEICGSANGRTRVNTGAGLDHVWTVTPRSFLNNRFNFTRFTQGRQNFSEGFDLSSIGFPRGLNDASLMRQFPRFEFDNFFRLGDTGTNSNPSELFQWFTSLNRIQGAHSWKVGTDLRLYRDNINLFQWSAGRYVFRSDWTRGPLDNAGPSPLGQDYASFLLGLASSGQIDWNDGQSAASKYLSFFVQDDWRVSKTLTLNLGLRYEADLPTTERFNRTVNGFAFDATNPLNSAARAAYAQRPIPEIAANDFVVRGGLRFASEDNRSVYQTQKTQFSPRFGFAWNPAKGASQTVVRGGFGLFYDSLGNSPGIVQSGFFQSTPYVSTLDAFLTPATTLSNPFPGGIDRPTGSSAGLGTFLGQSVSFFTTAPRNPYSIKWNFNIQRQFGSDLVVEVGYVGNRAVGLGMNQQLNFIPRQFLSTAPNRDVATINNLTAAVPNPFAGLVPNTNLNGGNIARNQLLRRYPQFLNSVVEQNRADGSSYFHAFQARIEKRLSRGLNILANYQFSKLMEMTSRLNDFDGPEKRIADVDRPHRVVVSASYELPWFRGSGGDWAARLGRSLAGGWIVNGIFVGQSGQPLVWGNVIYFGGDLNLNPRQVSRAFDTTRFNTSSRDQLEFNVRTFPSRFSNLRADRIRNFDLSLLKNFRIVERLQAQLRAEAFNALNTTQFNGPVLNPAVTTFGAITSQANQPRRMQLALRFLW